MGAWTNQFEGISVFEYETLLAKAKGDTAAESHILSLATDNRYHDPETQAFWEEEERKDRLADERYARTGGTRAQLVEHLGKSAEVCNPRQLGGRRHVPHPHWPGRVYGEPRWRSAPGYRGYPVLALPTA